MAHVSRVAVSGTVREIVGKIGGRLTVLYHAFKTMADNSNKGNALKHPDAINVMGWVTFLAIAGLRHRAMLLPLLVIGEMKKAARVLTQPRVMINVPRSNDLRG